MLIRMPRRWIIPAHAGFTVSHTRMKRLSKDHPRTRGVYACPPRMVFSVPGSSPHTRGLRNGASLDYQRRRIIPAHAGFTYDAVCDPVLDQDHPRTRGVYSSPKRLPSKSPGSSPHTRGLQAASGEITGPIGIIPAHAGFTRQGRNRYLPLSDHPRTRGVYCTMIPLARGTPDHPRTRGVYWHAVADVLSWVGSSPHTRGLQLPDYYEVIRMGIIPAHAGFTACFIWSKSIGWDHPRTRGVYSLFLIIAG